MGGPAQRRGRPPRALAAGPHIYLRAPRAADEVEFLAAVHASRRLHAPWVNPPADRDAYRAYLRRTRRDDFVSMLAWRRADARDARDDRIVGLFNLSQIFRGWFQNAYLGYWAVAEFASSGCMSAALPLVLEYAFGALCLHRLEANIQPENEPSRRLAARCGFRLEGFSPRYLKIRGRWRDHERWAITREDWVARRRTRDATPTVEQQFRFRVPGVALSPTIR
jgi:ribosomal-protein-alanine N-acetyltransferase